MMKIITKCRLIHYLINDDGEIIIESFDENFVEELKKGIENVDYFGNPIGTMYRIDNR